MFCSGARPRSVANVTNLPEPATADQSDADPSDAIPLDVAGQAAGPGAVRSAADDGGRPPPTTRWPATVLVVGGDVIAVAVLLTLLWWLQDRDGGLPLPVLRQLVLLLPLTLPIIWAELRRLPGTASLIVGASSLGWLLAFAFAAERSLWVGDGALVAMAPALFAAARRVWRRPWGPIALTVLLVGSFAQYAWDGLLKWWGWVQLGLQPRWDLLSWRNQSGALSGTFGLLFLGIGLRGRRTVPLVAINLAGLAFAGAWLSSSRAAAIIFPLAALVVTAVAWRWSSSTGQGGLTGGSRLQALGGAAAAAATAVAIVGILQSTLPIGTTGPLESRDQDAVGNLSARTEHWEAAFGMFANRPLVGQGPGSYTTMARQFNDPDGVLTSAAHNEWLEPFGESGLVHGLGVTGAGVAGLLLALRTLRRGKPDDLAEATPDPDVLGLREGLRLGGAAAVLGLGAHAGIDFDFHYPVLLGLFLLVVALQLPTAARDDATTPPRFATWLSAPHALWAAIAAVSLLFGVVVFGAVSERAATAAARVDTMAAAADEVAPWQTARVLFIANGLAQEGDMDRARALITDGRRWNPGDPRLVMLDARLDYRSGAISASQLAAALPPPPTHLNLYADIAEELLIGGNADLADTLAATTIAFWPEYRAWGLGETVARGWAVRIQVAADRSDCDLANDHLEQAIASGFDADGSRLAALTTLLQQVCPASGA